MFAGKLLKNINSASKNLPALTAWLVVFCIFSSFFQFQESRFAALPDLVFCPLQKTWVKSYKPETNIRRQPFDEICSTDARKNFLQIEFLLKTSHPATEQVIFDYLKKGDAIFAELNQLPDLPQRPLVKKVSFETAANNFSQDFGKYVFSNFTLPQNARPPTFSTLSLPFKFQFVRTLEQISRNINPRSPPIFS